MIKYKVYNKTNDEYLGGEFDNYEKADFARFGFQLFNKNCEIIIVKK